MKKEYIIPIFVPHLGCKQCCTFCNQRTISGEQKQVTAKDVIDLIKYVKEKVYEKYGIKIEEEIKILGDEL